MVRQLMHERQNEPTAPSAKTNDIKDDDPSIIHALHASTSEYACIIDFSDVINHYVQIEIDSYGLMGCIRPHIFNLPLNILLSKFKVLEWRWLTCIIKY